MSGHSCPHEAYLDEDPSICAASNPDLRDVRAPADKSVRVPLIWGKKMADATFIHRWFEEVWNKKREDAIDEMFAENGVANGLNDENGKRARGPERL